MPPAALNFNGMPSDDFAGLEPFVPGKHKRAVLVLAMRAFPFPSFFLGIILSLVSGLFGVVATDEQGVTGFFLGQESTTLGGKSVAQLLIVAVAKRARGKRLASRMGAYMMSGAHPAFRPDDFDEVLIEDTDLWNSPSWLWSDRLGVRYFPYAEQLRRFGLLGYLKMHLTLSHSVPGHFMKRLCQTPEEAAASDAAQRDRGLADLALAGILPTAYWVAHMAYSCGSLTDPAVCGYALAAVYLLLLARWAAAHVLAPAEGVAFRAYDMWVNPFGGFGCCMYAFWFGVPFLGWAGGFYIRAPGVNYARPEVSRRLGLMHVLPNLVSLAGFAAHTALRVAAPSVLREARFLNVLGLAAFFFSVTDVASPVLGFPSGGSALRRWHPLAWVLPFAAWAALLGVTLLVPEPSERPFAQPAAYCRPVGAML